MRILSGIQPSGKLHIGNYFGMMLPALELAQREEAFYFIANYHALTSIRDPDQLRQNTLDVALDFLACGLDPDRTVFYKQSDLSKTTELAWILSNVTPMPMLENCHSFKDKMAQGIKPNHGLFAYPVLMAADILIVQADVVPVGNDQKQHLEVCRDIASAFNRQFGEVFTIPEPSIRSDVAVVPGIDGRKMSKSYSNTIEIFGEEKAMKRKIMSIVTDSQAKEDPKKGLDKNIALQLYKMFASSDEYADLYHKLAVGGYGYGDLKKQLFEGLMEYFRRFRIKRDELSKNLDYIDVVLRKGAERASQVMNNTIEKTRKAVGLQ